MICQTLNLRLVGTSQVVRLFVIINFCFRSEVWPKPEACDNQAENLLVVKLHISLLDLRCLFHDLEDDEDLHACLIIA